MASVITLCLAGAGRQVMKADHLRGDLFRGNHVRKDVRYTTEPALENSEEGRDNLDDGLHAYPGYKKVVVGTSMGGQVIYKWLRDLGPASDIDPDDVIFVSTGNPERKYGGVTTVDAENMPGGITLPGIYGGVGIPDDTPYTVYDVAQQYEFWCDYPTGTINDTALANAIGGLFLHLDYSQVAVNDPKNVVYTEGNRHYVLAPTYPLPMISRLRSMSSRAALDAEYRTTVESAFDRPYSMPTPTVRRITSFLGWDTATNRLVSTYVPRWKPFG